MPSWRIPKLGIDAPLSLIGVPPSLRQYYKHLYKYPLSSNVCVCLAPRSLLPPPPPSPVQASVTSSLLLMQTVICSSTWVACLYSQSYSLPQLSALVLSGFQIDWPHHLMWVGGGRVYSGVASLMASAATTQPLMLCPSAARCWSSVREPSVPDPQMNRGPIDGARLWGSVVSPLLHAEEAIYSGPGRLPVVEERGWHSGPGFGRRGTKNMLHVSVCVHMSLCVWKFIHSHPG